MARLPLSMLRRYAREPGLAVRHGKAATVLLSRPGGVAALRGRLANLTANDSAAQAAAATAAVLAARFRQADIVARRQPAAVIRLLAPYTSDRAGIADPRLTALDRLRRLRRAILTETGLFDPVHYAACTPEAAGSDPLEHYLDHGLGRGARINAWFDPREYVGAHEDVAASGLDPVLHYALLGWQEGRHPGSWFDPSHYAAQEPAALEVMPDLGFASPLVHFVRYGVSAGHEARPRRGILGTDGHMATMVSDLPRKGVILIVSHDAEVGGAQHLCRTFATWLATHTRWEPRFVTMKGGNLAHTFASIAPTFDASAHPDNEVSRRLTAFAGPDVAVVWLNSVAAGGFFKIWDRDVPVVTMLHELPKILEMYREKLEVILARSTRIIGCARAVTDALQEKYGAEPERMRIRHGFIDAIDPALIALSGDKAAAKRALNLAEDEVVIAGCGVAHWRKRPDLWVDVAVRVLARHPRARFLWIGGGSDQAECEAQIARAGVSERISFTGFLADIKPHLAATDIFLLTSEEDPFPLVNLYAGALGSPVVCFDGAGGSPELVRDGGGRVVPFGDAAAMADVVCAWIEHPTERAREGAFLRERVLSRFTVAAAAPSLLHHLREAAGIAPDVSVVVPNYNYARYLPERLASIAGQTFQDFEVILLDDRSTDASVPILQGYADARTGTRLVVNAANSGSPFVQWLRGIEAARGDLVWIAEADDSAAPDLLAGLVTPMLDRNVMLAYAKSVPVGSDGAVLGDYEPLFLDRINTGRWSHSYLATDHEEVDAGLGIANCIPNASSVLFRRFLPEPDFAAMLTGMRMCGDWLFYLRAVRGGMVGFDAAPRNLHRRHDGTVTAATEGSPLYFDEIAQVRDYVARTYSLGKRAQAKIVDFTGQDIDRFGITDPARIARIEAEAVPQPADARHAVLVAVSDLGPGGGQMFAIRLANELTRQGHRAVLFNVGQYPDHPSVVATIHQRVALFRADGPLSLAEILARFDIDTVHSSLWWADRYIANHLDALGTRRWVVSMHGCHETLLANPAIDRTAAGLFGKMLARVDTWVPTAGKNRELFARHGKPLREASVANGVEGGAGVAIPREDLGLRHDALVLVLASRAIPEKGWQAAVDAVSRLNADGIAVDLLLIGAGAERDRLLREAPAHVVLIDQVENLRDYLATADIGLVPSTFKGESMPLVLLEMMAQGLPVVATDVGAIPQILADAGQGPAGVVVPLKDSRVDLPGFAQAIAALADPQARATMGAAARATFEADYTLERMVEGYVALYDAIPPRD